MNAKEIQNKQGSTSELDLSCRTVIQKDLQDQALRQLLTHIPDIVIDSDHTRPMPQVKHLIGVVLFADISGFTALCETFSNKAGKDVSCGTDQLTHTLNTYIGKIVEDILRNGGDVLKFAGDALLALWKTPDEDLSLTDLTLLVNKAIITSLAVQQECDNFMTDVGVLLRVKIAIAVGKMHVTYMGVSENKQFDLSGPAVDDVNAAEKWAEPGSIILSRLAWANCDQSLFTVELLEDGHHSRVKGAKVEEAHEIALTANRTSVYLASMAGLITTNNMIWATPTVAKRIFGPHLGSVLKTNFPDLDLPRIYRKRKKNEKSQKDKDICKISGKLLRSASFHDPDHRTDVYEQLNSNDIEDLRAYVPKPVLFKIDHGQDLEYLSEMRVVSTLFINMVLPASQPGDKVTWAVQRAFEIINENVQRYRGNLNKVFSFDKGCTFLVIFGLPGDKHDDDPTRALRAGHRILDSLHAVMEITNEAIGVTTGRAFCGVVGHRDRHEYTVIGRKVNMAARLMVNYPEVLSCDDETFRSAKSKLKNEDFVELPGRTLKGIADPGTVREYNRHHDREAEDDNELEYPIIGRSKERDEIKKLLHSIKVDHTEGGRRVVIVEGEAGIGKTRLLEEFMDDAEEEDFKVDYVEADMAHAHTPYYIVQSLVSILLELEECRTAAEREHALREHITDDTLKEDLCLLNDLLGTHVPAHPKFAHMEIELRTQHFHKLLFGIVHQFAVDRPCLFAVDGANYIDPDSWDFLEDLAQDSHAILVLALRPFSSSNPPPKAAVKLISNPENKKFVLRGLPENVMSDLACQFMDVMSIPKELDTILRQKSHGVASWCEQLIKDMIISNNIMIVPTKEAFKQNDDEQTKDQAKGRPSISLSMKSITSFVMDDGDFPRRSSTPTYSDFADKSLRASVLRRMSLPATQTKKASSSVKGHSSSLSIASHVNTGALIEVDEYPEDSWNPERHRHSLASSSSDPYSRRESLDLEAIKETLVSVNYNFEPIDFVPAAENSMPHDTSKVCIIAPGVDLSKVLVPDSVKDMVLARVDRMLPGEQLILKCASILGLSFSKNVLEAILPNSMANVDIVVYNLAKEGILECASLAMAHQHAHNHHGFYDYNEPNSAHQHTHHHHHHHHHNVTMSLHASVLCGCYADEGSKVINLTRLMTPSGPKKQCLFLKFSNVYVQETTYSLWLQDQKKDLHERAAMFLESQAHKCKSCGGGGFTPGHSSSHGGHESRNATSHATSHATNSDIHGGAVRKMLQSRAAGTTGRSSAVSETIKRQKTMEMRDKVRGHGAFSDRTFTRSSVVPARKRNEIIKAIGTQSITANQKYFQSESLGIGNALVHSSGSFVNTTVGTRRTSKPTLISRIFGRNSRVDDEQIERTKQKWKKGFKLLKKSNRVEEEDETSFNEEEGQTNEPRMTFSTLIEQVLELKNSMDGLDTVDLSKCQCAEILSSVFPQLVHHWRAAGNSLKTFRYLSESGAAALAISSNMQAIAYLNEARSLFDEKAPGGEAIATKEEKARIESLTGQALFHMNRLDDALKHLLCALRFLGDKLPTSSFGVHMRIRKETIRHHLHVLLEEYFVGRAGENSERLIEQARCLYHISHVFHVLHENKKSLMAAMIQLNAAEEAEENVHELITAYAAVVECTQLVGWSSLSMRYENIGLAKCEDPSVYSTPEGMVTVGHLYCVSLTFRLAIGNIAAAIDSGQHALSIANRVKDLAMKISCSPLLAQSLLMASRILNSEEVLRGLKYAARENEDSHGKALYMCCCLDMILEAGNKIEDLDDIIDFSAKAATDPAFAADIIPKYYFNSSLALWHARLREWDKVEPFLKAAFALQPQNLDVFMAVHGFVKLVEIRLLQLSANPRNRSLQLDAEKALKQLKKSCKLFPVFIPRLLHLRAYFAFLNNKTSKSKTLLEKCVNMGRHLGLALEISWAYQHLNIWYTRHAAVSHRYDGNSKFVLPLKILNT